MQIIIYKKLKGNRDLKWHESNGHQTTWYTAKNQMVSKQLIAFIKN